MRLVGHTQDSNIYGMSPTEGNRLDRIFSLIACHAQLLYPESCITQENTLLDSGKTSRAQVEYKLDADLEHTRDEALLAIAGVVLLLAFGLLLWVCALSTPHGSNTLPKLSPVGYQMRHQISTLDVKDEVMQPDIASSNAWQLDPEQVESIAPFLPQNNSPYKTETLGQYHLEP